MELYPIQKEAVKQFFAPLAYGNLPSASLVEAGTGTGKTIVGIEIGRRLLEQGIVDKVVFATPTKDLQQKVIEEVDKYNRGFGTAIKATMLVGQGNYVSPARLEKVWNDLNDDEKKQIADKNGRIYASFETLMAEVEKKDGIYEALDLSPTARDLLPAVLICMRGGKGEEETEHGVFYRQAVESASSADFVILNHTLLSCLTLRHLILKKKNGGGVRFPLINAEKPVFIVDEAHRFPYAAMLVSGRNARVSLKSLARLVDVGVRELSKLKQKIKGKSGKPFKVFRQLFRDFKKNYEVALDDRKTLLGYVQNVAMQYREVLLEENEGIVSFKPIWGITHLHREFPDISELLEKLHILGLKWKIDRSVVENCLEKQGKEEKELLVLIEEINERFAKMADIYHALCAADGNVNNNDEAVFLSFSPVWAFPSFHLGTYNPHMITSAGLSKAGLLVLMSATLFDHSGKDLVLKNLWKFGGEWKTGKLTIKGTAKLKFRSPLADNEKPCIFVNPFEVKEVKERWGITLPCPPVPGDKNYKSKEDEWVLLNIYLLRHLCRLTDGGILVLTRAYDFKEKFLEKLKEQAEAEVKDDVLYYLGRKVITHTKPEGIKKSDFLVRRQEFVEEGNGIFVCTQQGWEGIDVPGKALSAVLITRLPYPAPHDPVMLYFSKHAEKLYFYAQQTLAAWGLKQGIGRLVRTPKDWGYVAVGDGRAYEKKNYVLLRKGCEDLNVVGIESVVGEE